ncbi:MAG TPA: hypothetical protein VHZ25_05990 [Acidobacteriaceae bacterium]|jgi:hypothetical protein|nr:hypothetical protein [Acidobacteriaceae bacterium]
MPSLTDKTIGKLATLATLAVGIGIGFVCGTLYHPRQEVRAQAVAPPAPNFKDVTPGITVGSMGTNLLLAHEIAADSLVVNGYDILKLQQGLINYMAARPYAETADFQNIINASRATIVYRYKPPTPPPAQNQPMATPEKK